MGELWHLPVLSVASSTNHHLMKLKFENLLYQRSIFNQIYDHKFLFWSKTNGHLMKLKFLKIIYQRNI